MLFEAGYLDHVYVPKFIKLLLYGLLIRYFLWHAVEQVYQKVNCDYY